jgi:3D (Asp-Asp-Asp) domain-containing protein
MHPLTLTTIALILHTGHARQVTITAYCPCRQCCGDHTDGLTASGHRIRPGDRFAAGPPGLPFGTLVAVPGYGLVPVLDRGGSIRGDRLDVFFGSHREALAWGRRVLVVWVWNGFGG